MKLRHPILQKIAGFGLSYVLRGLVSTVGFQFRSLSSEDVEPRQDNPQRFLYSCWHENLAVMVAHYGGPHLCGLISEHADGRLITEACRHMRMKSVVGSSTRGGVRALRQLLRQRSQLSLAWTPDGPRGPRREVKSGAIYLASRSGLPIVPMGVGYQRAWRLRSWDRLAIPWPCSKVYCVGGAPILVPRYLDKDGIEDYRLIVQLAMDEVQEQVALTMQGREGTLMARRTGLAGETEGRYRAASFANDR